MIQCSEESKRYFNAFTECQLNTVKLAETCTQLTTECSHGVYHIIGIAVTFLLIGLASKELFVYLFKNGGWELLRMKALELYVLIIESAIKQATLPSPTMYLECNRCSSLITGRGICTTCTQRDQEEEMKEAQQKQLIKEVEERMNKETSACAVCKISLTDFWSYKGIISCTDCYQALKHRDWELTCSKCNRLKEANQMALTRGSLPLCNHCYDTEFHSSLGRMREQTYEESKTEADIVQ
jgi:hypothetical protein